ncbi:Na(+)/H(+) antiporter subunit B [Wolbachia endosymbiont of Howardula sp.]|uniref:Na(+)/H(+) antiporter subunit B n=1 Tax=Wolbachia endosymbiont of Howardula sp. TaxID=2916816 RepID=UPI00217CCA06|nr:Na(+)/H(+) antiporter subunit B [Wolbachia endosymbiont of Howardula sp.]UWI83003.1 Na(+)/H(+) antiporter subunit B [Wolbachia endosymbiont of Howardula sp.]
MHKDYILNMVAFLIIPYIILFGLYVLFHSDSTPGGGFQAGIITSSGIILYSMIFGISITLKTFSYSIMKFVSVLGIFIYLGTGMIPMLFGKNFLSYNALSYRIITGQKLGILLVELGVQFTVCTSMLIIYREFSLKRE